MSTAPTTSDHHPRRDAIAENVSQILGRVTPLLEARERVTGLTIDGPTSLDLDDMLNVRRDGTGYLVEISLANPGAVILPGEPVDLDAARRVSTRYFRSGNDPMLSRRLSEEGLSLLPNAARPARTIFVPFSSTFAIGKPEMRLTAATSYAKLHYEEAGRAMTDRNSPHVETLGMLARVAEACLEMRRRGGAIAFYDPARGMVASEEGALVRVRKVDVHAHIIIQEMMILANRFTAKFALDNGVPILFRNHKARPDTNRDLLLRQIADAFHLGTEDSIIRTMADLSATMGRAYHSPRCEGHFALNVSAYAQVSSALRRYQDLLSDRNITAHLLAQPLPHSPAQLTTLAQRINEVETDVRDSKAAAMKAAAERRASLVLPTRLPAIPAATFSQVVKLACNQAAPPPGLDDALSHRALSLLDIERILFTAPRSPEWQATRELTAKKALKMGRSVALQLLNQAQQRGVLESFRIHSKAESAGEATLIHAAGSARIQGQDVQALEEVSLNRTDATQRAAWRLLFQLCDLPPSLLPPAHLPIAPAQVQPAVSWKNALLEICQAAGQNGPEFLSERSGAPHNPVFRVSVQLSLRGTQYDGTGTGKTKIAAEQAAAQRVVEAIRAALPPKPAKVTQSTPQSSAPPTKPVSVAAQSTGNPTTQLDEAAIQSTTNPKGLLFEWCQKNHVAMPSFERRNVPLETAPSGQGNAVIARLRYKKALIESPESSSALAKQAEQATCRWLLEELLRRSRTAEPPPPTAAG